MSNLKFKLANEKLSHEELYNNKVENESTKENKVKLSLSEGESKSNDNSHDQKNESGQKKSKKRTNKFFYKVSNHQELFRIGKSFYSDYLTGVKSFAITSTGYQTSQQKSILGLASFFDHKEELKIGIISDNLYVGAFKDILKLSKDREYDYFGKESSINIHSFYNHFDFIDMNEVLDICNNEEIDAYDEVLDHLSEVYDVIFWDVPELHKIQMDSEKYFPVIMKFESISIIVSQSLSKKGDIEDIKRFFLGYGINLKGLLLEENKSINSSDENSDESSKSNVKKATEESVVDNSKKSFWRKLFK